MTDRLTDRELATILAALRYWQQDLAQNEGGPISPEHFQEGIAPLTVEEINDLCERVNSGPTARSSPDSWATTSPTVYVLLRNESDRRVCLGAFKSEKGAREAITEDREELDGIYGASDYDVIQSTLDD